MSPRADTDSVEDAMKRALDLDAMPESMRRMPVHGVEPGRPNGLPPASWSPADAP